MVSSGRGYDLDSATGWLVRGPIEVIEPAAQDKPGQDRWRVLRELVLGCDCAGGIRARGQHDGRDLLLCSAETTQDDYFAGRSVGHLDLVRVDVPGVQCP